MYSLSQAAFNVTHWVFALKYWVLAYKLQLLARSIDPNQHNRKFIFMYYGGIVINAVCGIVYGIPLS